MTELIAVLIALPALTWLVIMSCVASALHALEDKRTDPSVGLTAWLSGSFFGVIFTQLAAFIILKIGWLSDAEYEHIGWAIAAMIAYSATDWLLAVRKINAQIKAAPIEFAMDLMAGFLTNTLEFVNKYRKPKSL